MPLDSQARLQSSSVAIVGAACRLPGAPDEIAFWHLLDGGGCAVGDVPAGRWSAARYLHPRGSEPGFSYSFAGGYIDEPLAFDPGVFGISPREAAEMDPQQRLLLEAVWSALEDAGIGPGTLAGGNVGVYVGASGLDYGALQVADLGGIDSHFMTGNTLSVLSNRISYIFDLRGPSFTVDTACSSSLVAFAQAQAAIASGQIDTAIVAGVNMLLSPFPFIGFSRAGMLSRTGLCQSFGAGADGYVRGEGVVAMVISRLETAIARRHNVRAVALASGVNSDGRTNGIALPATEGQRSLLEEIYGSGGIDPERLAFIEAHGTGTAVGDPAEALAIGEALGQRRRAPLPIGSVKSNIGHLEPASGLAGLLKAILALEHRRLPASLHAASANPAIDFAALNLRLATEPTDLPADGVWLAGVSSFGFGGTNAHVVIRQPEQFELPAASAPAVDGPQAELLVLSAHSRAALSAVSADYAALLEAGQEPARLAGAVAWQRDLAGYRLALPVGHVNAAALRGFASGGALPGGAQGAAPSQAPTVCFVYSGNGAQWSGMGRAAFAANAVFRAKFRAVDASFARFARWSLEEALHDPDLSGSRSAELIQPLLFAVQSALTAGLAALGLVPDMVLGHSIGEIAAAEAAGALDMDEAVRVIFHRSAQQQAAHGLGGMAVANISHEGALALFAEPGLAGLEIAAINGPGSVSISGPMPALEAFAKLARRRRVAARVLDLPYPFHCSLLDTLREPVLAAFGTIVCRRGGVAFVSTVTGGVLPGTALDTGYWWRNVRAPVLFSDAIETAGRQGASVFVEIGPRAILQGNITATLRQAGLDGAVLPSLSEKERDGDPLMMVLARAIVLGCKVDRRRLFGARPGGRVRLPPYAWQRRDFRQPQTSEAMDLCRDAPRHALLGTRLREGTPEWRNLIDADTIPYLADHRIDGEVVLPASAFAEMALAVARELHPEGSVGLEDFDLLAWLTLPAGQMRETSVRLQGDDTHVEIWSRARFATGAWTLHARGRIVRIASPAPQTAARVGLPHTLTAEAVYASAALSGVDYGASFRRVLGGSRSNTLIEVDLAPVAHADQAGAAYVLHPVALDAAFHAMFDNIKRRATERHAYLPVRFAGLRVEQDGAAPVHACVVIDRETDLSLSVSLMLTDAAGRVVASLTGGLFRAVVLERHVPEQVFFHQGSVRLQRLAPASDARDCVDAALAALGGQTPPESWLYLGAFTRALAFENLRAVHGEAEIVAHAKDAASDLQAALLTGLGRAGLATRTPSGWRLAETSGLPDSADILRTFAAEHPEANVEILLAAHAQASLTGALRTGAPAALSAATAERFDAASILFAPILDAALAVCTALQARFAPEPLRILVAEPFCLGILQRLAGILQDGSVSISVLGTDARRLSLLQARRVGADGVAFLHEDAAVEPAFDVALCLALGPWSDDAALGPALAQRLAPGGMLCILQPPESTIYDCLLGTQEDWFAPAPGAPLGRIAAGRDTRLLLQRGVFTDACSHSLGDNVGSILVAQAVPRPANHEAADGVDVVLLQDWPALEAALRQSGTIVRREAGAPVAGETLVFQAQPAGPQHLAACLAELAAVLRTAGATTRLWLVVRGLRAPDAAGIDPLAEAIWSFARAAINEYPGIDLRLVDVARGLDDSAAASRLSALIADPGQETELLLDTAGVSAMRLRAGLPGSTPVEAARLEFGAGQGALAGAEWVEASRRAPEPGEIEIRVAAAGLNFRDVMLASGLLNDDVLDDGMAGAVLGFEAAGEVLRVGQGVSHLQAGDQVMGLCRASFATHATADARVFVRVPDGIATQAAATIPVAFLTAWYALVQVGQIQPGEWVLIHGAAGGVGLAAMQIARLRGARIAATVGSPEKRALVAAMGAERIYSSRSTAFADAVRADIGGVDVVLNSLAGDAMQAGLKCLKPFGRFIELGKRDYVLNTNLGLRPFRRNLSYFGVDLDQLLAANLGLVKRLLAELAGHFADGSLSPLPYQAFDWHEAGRAFHLMQSAGHVGKILVRPPAEPRVARAAGAVFQPGQGAHLVVGGTGGFGFEAASWLAEAGAATVVVASRKGVIEPALLARSKALRAGGTDLIAETLDVTDAGAVAALVARLTREHGRVAGVIHAAVVLDDALIANLDAHGIAAVLAPKVAGAANLDQATSGAKLDYFVAFSSVAAMVGNPGQAAYVAANGYLQGLMARRRAAGLPSLAVGWGAIADAGLLARNPAGAARLAALSGIAAMPARTALAHLGTLLADPARTPAALYCARLRHGQARQHLKLLQTPAFSFLLPTEEAQAEAETDLASRIAGKNDGEARALVAALVAAEVGRIFRLPPGEIVLARPLDEMGLDSLMSLDLRMSIEKRFGIELPVMVISAGVSVNEIAARLIASLRSGERAPDESDQEIMRRHGLQPPALPAGVPAAEETAFDNPELRGDRPVALV